MAGVIKTGIAFVLSNFSLTFMVIGLLFSMVCAPIPHHRVPSDNALP
jgi:hypothetical protein